MEKIMACSPNISDGEDIKKIKKILSPIERNKNLKLLLVHSFKGYNRTKAYFIGNPEDVIAGAKELVKNAMEVIDMTKHTGDHPRIGSIDVLPFIPVKGITIEECVSAAHEVGKEVGAVNNIPVFYYGHAALKEEFRELSNLREDEYEGIRELFKTGEIQSDEGAKTFNEKSGAIAIGARRHVVDLKININTNNIEIADKIAKKIRESGVYNIDGTHESGKLQGVKAAGFKGVNNTNAFVYLSIVNTEVSPIHIAYIEVKRALENLNYDIESTEVKGFVFKNMLLEAGKAFALRSNREILKEKELIAYALESMKVKEFNIKKRMIDA